VQSASAALDPPTLPSISKHDARFGMFLRPVTLTFDFFELKIGNPLTRAVGNVCANFDFSAFVFELRDRTGETHGRTDGQTDGQDA